MKPLKFILAAGAAALAISASAQSQPHNLMTIDAGEKGIPVPETMYGLFFEDINFAADGGLYAEKIKNRSFEFDDPFMGWEIFGNVKLMNDGPFERNPHYVRLGYPGHPVRFTGIENEGFFGIGVEEGKEYRFTVWARTAGTKEKEYISFHLCQKATMGEEQMFESGYIEVDSKEWKKYEAVFTSPITEPKAAFRIFLEWNGEEPDATQAVDLEHISLFPVETFNGHENGLRKDIAETLKALDPGVFRFPGGCIVEGTTLDNRYQWKNSVGPVENRPINVNRWNYSFAHRLFPDYFQSYGLGFYEYFLFAEEIGAEPLPVISCGMACQFQNDPAWHPHAELDDLECFVQDAVDLIEFANGGVDIETKERLFDKAYCRYVNAIMVTCGMYDGSGEFAINVGVPAKSGVGGGIMAVVPRRMGIGLYFSFSEEPNKWITLGIIELLILMAIIFRYHINILYILGYVFVFVLVC